MFTSSYTGMQTMMNRLEDGVKNINKVLWYTGQALVTDPLSVCRSTAFGFTLGGLFLGTPATIIIGTIQLLSGSVINMEDLFLLYVKRIIATDHPLCKLNEVTTYGFEMQRSTAYFVDCPGRIFEGVAATIESFQYAYDDWQASPKQANFHIPLLVAGSILGGIGGFCLGVSFVNKDSKVDYNELQRLKKEEIIKQQYLKKSDLAKKYLLTLFYNKIINLSLNHDIFNCQLLMDPEDLQKIVLSLPEIDFKIEGDKNRTLIKKFKEDYDLFIKHPQAITIKFVVNMYAILDFIVNKIKNFKDPQFRIDWYKNINIVDMKKFVQKIHDANKMYSHRSTSVLKINR